jgi:hypothetical protein
MTMAQLVPSILDAAPSLESWPAGLHDPRGRGAPLAELAGWQVHGLRGGLAEARQWSRSGLWHVQLWHQTARVSLLLFPRGSAMGPCEIASVRGVIGQPASHAALVGLLLVRGLPEPPTEDRIGRLLDIVFTRQLELLGRAVASGAVGPRAAC